MAAIDLKRRGLLLAATWTALAAAAAKADATGTTGARRYAAVVFDGFPIFDLRPVGTMVESLFPGRGAELTAAWRTRQFEYQWLHALSGTYVDFRQATEAALVFACRSMEIVLADADRGALVSLFDALPVWPDVAPTIAALRRAGVKTAILSNMTAKMLHGALVGARLADGFDAVLSTDAIRSYKPAPAAYRMATHALRLRREQILFAPFAGWDAAGAQAFGYPTFWVNRFGAPAEELGDAPEGSGGNLADMMTFAGLQVD